MVPTSRNRELHEPSPTPTPTTGGRPQIEEHHIEPLYVCPTSGGPRFPHPPHNLCCGGRGDRNPQHELRTALFSELPPQMGVQLKPCQPSFTMHHVTRQYGADDRSEEHILLRGRIPPSHRGQNVPLWGWIQSCHSCVLTYPLLARRQG